MKNSGKIKRNITLAIVAFLSAFIEYFSSVLISKLFVSNKMPEGALIAINLVIYAILFLFVYNFFPLIIKLKWFRRFILGEKIIEGKWFAILSQSGKNCSCAVVETFYDDNDELKYSAEIYSLRTFEKIGEINSICSLVDYNKNGSTVELKCAHTYVYHENRECSKSKSESGYGYITFTDGNPCCELHNGHFDTTDNSVIYLEATRIKCKKTLSNLASKRKNTLQQLYTEYLNEDKTISQSKKMDDLYSRSPELYHQFAQKEDSRRNLTEKLRKFDFNNKTILDMGVGTGRFTEIILNNANVEKIICSDSSKEMLDFVKQSTFYNVNKDKIELLHCDHLALPTFIPKHSVDFIIAGYSIGACYNDDFLTVEQKNIFLEKILEVAKDILTENGTMIIIETKGIKGFLSDSSCVLFDYDISLETCYKMLEQQFKFIPDSVDTSFEFDSEREAKEIISIVWGEKGCNYIQEPTDSSDKWTLQETSGFWTKTFKKE